MRMKMKKKVFRIMFMLAILSTLLFLVSMAVNADAGDIITVQNSDGISVNYKILSESGDVGTVEVGKGDYMSTAINTSGHLTIPQSVIYGNRAYTVIGIGDSSFEKCKSIAGITIPDCVTNIGGFAFAECVNLTGITIPNTVTSIGESAFRECRSLTSVTIPDGVTSILDNTFIGCDSLTSVTIPNSVTNVGESAFSNCYSLINVTIPDNVTCIGDFAFIDCRNLTSIRIPDTITSIGMGAFSACKNLTEIIIGKDNVNYCIVEGWKEGCQHPGYQSVF